MTSRLLDPLGTTDALAEIFSDASVLQAMLDVEVALARAAAAAGAIPGRAADAIAAAARTNDFDAAAIARDARAPATPAIPLVHALIERVRSIDPDAASYVHWGATSQDVTDSALVLLLARALPVIRRDHQRLQAALRRLSDAHAGTVMLGRTLLQPATPITFGLEAARWHAAARRAWRRLERAWTHALVLQFGGATGTRAAAGEHAAGIAAALAEALHLAPGPPWHTDRDRLGALVSGCGLYTAALGKMARDLALLMQAEVAEAAVPGGGSSTMPHKRNPAACAIAIAAATRVPGLVATFLAGMLQEHERGVGGPQAEWPAVAAAVQLTGAATAAMAGAAEGLRVDPARMRANLEATGGIVFSERVMMRLLPEIGRERAGQLVTAAIARSRAHGDTFGDAIRNTAEIARVLTPEFLRDIDRPEAYLGQAETIRQMLLSEDDSSTEE